MRQDTREKRQAEIEAAAYDVLEERGYSGASMLAIARKARASNETLYNWYGDKTGLFGALVRGNAAACREHLETRVTQGGDAIATLSGFGPALLGMLTGDRAVALNRAAAADTTGALGKILAEEGRKTIAPLLADVLDLARSQNLLDGKDLHEMTETYLNLLIGDIQVRRVTGQLPQLTPEECERRSAQALRHMQALYNSDR